MPADEMPRLRRYDYVANSNDSHWLTNTAAPLEGYSPTISNVKTKRPLRTRAGISFVEELTKMGDVTSIDLQNMLFSHRNYAAELLLNDVLKVCTPSTNEIAELRSVLESWDRTMNLDSQGSQVWTEFWLKARLIPDLFTIPFDVDDAANTPRGIATNKSEVRAQIIAALKAAQEKLTMAGISLDAPLREIQYTVVNDEKIPIPGGNGEVGMYSLTAAPLQKDQGYTPIFGGNSFIQVTTWDENGKLDARGILTYSQSQEADSEHNSDQTQLYSRNKLVRFPFTDDEINAGPNLTILHLTESS